MELHYQLKDDKTLIITLRGMIFTNEVLRLTAVTRNENVAKCQTNSPRPLNVAATGSRSCSQPGEHRNRHDSRVLRCGTTSHADSTQRIG
jgi:hypothetical protein